jgi:hypothetical protein
LNAQQCKRKYQENEDHAALEVKEAACSQINQGMSNVTHPVSSFMEAMQQEINKSKEAWVR